MYHIAADQAPLWPLVSYNEFRHKNLHHLKFIVKYNKSNFKRANHSERRSNLSRFGELIKYFWGKCSEPSTRPLPTHLMHIDSISFKISKEWDLAVKWTILQKHRQSFAGFILFKSELFCTPIALTVTVATLDLLARPVQDLSSHVKHLQW